MEYFMYISGLPRIASLFGRSWLSWPSFRGPSGMFFVGGRYSSEKERIGVFPYFIWNRYVLKNEWKGQIGWRKRPLFGAWNR